MNTFPINDKAKKVFVVLSDEEVDIQFPKARNRLNEQQTRNWLKIPKEHKPKCWVKIGLQSFWPFCLDRKGRLHIVNSVFYGLNNNFTYMWDGDDWIDN